MLQVPPLHFRLLWSIFLEVFYKPYQYKFKYLTTVYSNSDCGLVRIYHSIFYELWDPDISLHCPFKVTALNTKKACHCLVFYSGHIRKGDMPPMVCSPWLLVFTPESKWYVGGWRRTREKENTIELTRTEF